MACQPSLPTRKRAACLAHRMYELPTKRAALFGGLVFSLLLMEKIDSRQQHGNTHFLGCLRLYCHTPQAPSPKGASGWYVAWLVRGLLPDDAFILQGAHLPALEKMIPIVAYLLEIIVSHTVLGAI